MWRLLSTVDRDEDLKHYQFSKIVEIFSTAYFTMKSDRPHYSPQLLTTADMVKDLGYKRLVLGIKNTPLNL